MNPMKFESMGSDVELKRELSDFISLANDLFCQHEEEYRKIEHRRSMQYMPAHEKVRFPNWQNDLENIGGPVAEKEKNFQHAFVKLKILKRHLEDAAEGQRPLRKDGEQLQIASGGEWKNIEDELANIELGLNSK